MRRWFSGAQGRNKGSCRQLAWHGLIQRPYRGRAFLPQKNLCRGCLRCPRQAATQKHSEHQNELFVHHQFSFLFVASFSPEKPRDGLKPGPNQRKRPVRFTLSLSLRNSGISSCLWILVNSASQRAFTHGKAARANTPHPPRTLALHQLLRGTYSHSFYILRELACQPGIARTSGHNCSCQFMRGTPGWGRWKLRGVRHGYGHDGNLWVAESGVILGYSPVEGTGVKFGFLTRSLR
jgi:hypothetical protein